MFKLVTLDRHLDICTLKSTKRSSLRGSSKVDEVPLPKKCRRSNKRKAPVKTEVSGEKDSPTTSKTTAKSDTVKPQEVPNQKKTRLKQAAGNVPTVEGTTVSTAEPKNDKVEPKEDVLNRNKTTSEQTATTSTTTVERSTAIAAKCVSESDKQMSKAYKTVLSGMQHLKNAMQKTIESNNALASEKLQEEAALLQEENEKKALEEEKKKKAATRKRKAKSGGEGKSKKKKQLQETEEINIVVPEESTSKTEKVAEGSPPSKTEVISLKSPAAEKSSSQESAAKVPGCSQETNKMPSNTSSQDSNAKVPSGGNSQDLCGGGGKDDDESRMAPPPMDDNLKKNNNTVEEAKEICSLQDSEKVKEKEPEKLTNVEEEKKVKDQESVKEDIIRPTVSRRSRKSRKYDDSDSEDNQMEEEEDQDEDDEELAHPPPPAAPSRRSSRAAANKVSYKDLDNSSDDDDEEAEDGEQEVPKRRKKKVPMKPELAYKQAKEKANRRKKKNESDDDYNPDAKDGDDKDEEEDEDEPTIDVEALFAKKFYIPAKEYQLPRKDRAAKFEKMKNPHPGQPKILTGGVLRDYQVTGFQWLKILFENGENGILADEMGLGKTIQCIAMICKLIQSGVSGPHIVVSPTTTLSNWYSEFQRFAPAVPVVFYHGNCEERSYLVKKFIHEVDVLGNRDYVLITSYEIMMRDRSVLTNFNWGYMVMDEAHRAKNFESQTLRELRRFLVKNKVLLTGTPLQNNLGELWTLLNFLFPDIFDEMKAFQNFFDFDLLCKDDKILNMLHQVLTPFLLRRTKNDVDVKIPPKREILVMVPMATLQKQYYDAIVDKSITRLLQNEEYYDETPGVTDPDTKGKRKNTKRELRDQIEKSTDKKGDGKLKTTEIQFGDAVVNVTMNNIMMQLRKCCNHPYLISYPLLPGTDDLRIDEDIVGSCGKVMLLDRMLPQLKERGHKVLLYSQMTAVLDIIEEYCNLREMSFVRFDGSTPCDQRFANIDRFNEDESIFLFLLSTRAGGLGVNLTAADTVIIYDSDWNPQNDVQAQDRCHRIGQTRPVVIYRLVAANTVDHKIVKRAAEKRVLENVIMHKGKFKGNLKNELKSKKSTTSERLLSILKETNKSAAVVASPSEVISETRLQQLLDRSDMTSSARTVSSDVTPANSQGGSSQEEGTSPQVKFKVILNSVVDENLCVT